MGNEIPKEKSPRRVRAKPGIYYRVDRAGKKRYEITYRDSDGRQRWQTIPGGVRAAELALADKKARMGRGERVAPTPGLTFGQAAERWEEAQAARLRPATQAAYSSSLRIHLLPAWRNRKMDSLSVDDIAQLIEEKRAAGYKAWTIRGMLTPTGRIFDFAIRRLGWAGQNPVRLLDRSERPASDSTPSRVLTRKELARLIEAAEGKYRLIFSFAAATGARLGECLGLKWSKIDFENGTVEISHQLNRSRSYVPLKTVRSHRTIELPNSVLSGLRSHKLATEYSKDHDFVFTTKLGTPHDHRNIGGRVLARGIKKASIDIELQPAPTFHSFRHGFASAWIADGGNLVELSAHLGHGDPSVTARVYAHEFEKATRSEARRSRIESMLGDSIAVAGGSTNVQSGGKVAPMLAEVARGEA